ncbi:putative mediator of RNA polymerase II transcription subunit 21 [Malaya genurostris]|uniref:putative mediator of RNA polymerase II transcription subunit 21 n=1 Tax=Malaya genurostris TaxID=325434 RepID=UPI0026F3F6AA|nr:putative mediator of RNA polymerase II transcription subunit 21 [Malaya genurostris]
MDYQLFQHHLQAQPFYQPLLQMQPVHPWQQWHWLQQQQQPWLQQQQQPWLQQHQWLQQPLPLQMLQQPQEPQQQQQQQPRKRQQQPQQRQQQPQQRPQQRQQQRQQQPQQRPQQRQKQQRKRLQQFDSDQIKKDLIKLRKMGRNFLTFGRQIRRRIKLASLPRIESTEHLNNINCMVKRLYDDFNS